MSAFLPIGYVGLLDAARMLVQVMYAGTPDLPAVASLRQRGMSVGDRQALHRAIDELWNGVDTGTLRPVAVGGHPRRRIRLDAEDAKGIPMLRSPLGRGFAFLRPSNPIYHKMESWFGRDLSGVVLAFEEKDVQKLARKLKRRRRTATPSGKKPRGRPSRQEMVSPIIRQLIESKKWPPLSSMKALTQLVNRKIVDEVSEETVSRALDRLHQDTDDRRFERVRKGRGKSKTEKAAADLPIRKRSSAVS
jgi:hypothetical protein